MLSVVAAVVALFGLLVVTTLIVWNFVRSDGDEYRGHDRDGRRDRHDNDGHRDRDHRGDGHRDGTRVNVPTRGPVTAYRQVGILSTANKSQDGAQKNNVLPLYARQTYNRSSRFNYYTQLESGVRIPLSMGGKPCEASLGCPEVYDGDKVVIDQLGATFTVDLYDEAPIRYLPDRY